MNLIMLFVAIAIIGYVANMVFEEEVENEYFIDQEYVGPYDYDDYGDVTEKDRMVNDYKPEIEDTLTISNNDFERKMIQDCLDMGLDC